MIDNYLQNLITQKKISYEQAKVYQLFACSELGVEWLREMTDATFMEEAPATNVTPHMVMFFDGRRSIMRDIKVLIKMVNHLIKELENDNGRSEQDTA